MPANAPDATACPNLSMRLGLREPWGERDRERERERERDREREREIERERVRYIEILSMRTQTHTFKLSNETPTLTCRLAKYCFA